MVMSMMTLAPCGFSRTRAGVGMRELGVHIVSQYIYINGIWQVSFDLRFDRISDEFPK